MGKIDGKSGKGVTESELLKYRCESEEMTERTREST